MWTGSRLRALPLLVALVLPVLVSPAARAVERRVAITVDDLPLGGPVAAGDVQTVRRVNRELLAGLVKHGAQAVGFVNEGKLYLQGEIDARVAVLEQWLDSGMLLGNHTYSHLSLHTTPVADFEDEVIRGEVVTRRLVEEAGRRLQYFRYPFSQTGPTAEVKARVEAFLADRRYTIAPFTIEHSDRLFHRAHLAAVSSGRSDRAGEIREAYLDHLFRMFDFFERLSLDLFAREIPQVLLLHANGLTAELLDEALGGLRARGYEFVSLAEALSDPAYRTADIYVGPAGVSWLHRWSLARGVPPTTILNRTLPSTFLREPDPPALILSLK